MSTPEALFRNALDLNRFGNSVARRIINSYNDIILNSVNELRLIEDLDESAKAARLRSIIAQLKDSLNTWAGDSTELTVVELQGLAELQSEFVEDQLRRVLPAGSRSVVNNIEISPQFAQSVVVTDPTQINTVVLSDDLFAAVQGAPQTFSLTAAEGATLTLPNGQVVSKSFRGIAENQADLFAQVVRSGLLSGETTSQISKRLTGRLRFNQPGSPRQIAAAGGQATSVANHQVETLVKTSINQVANAASQQVYEANNDVTKKYRYVATLDSRTTSICRALDGKEFEYGKGPTPPQHFNCRSTTVAVVDYKGLGLTPPPEGTRASAVGQVPVNTNYGQWLVDNPEEKKKALGEKAPYFDRLVRKYGAKNVMAKFVREDGSEVTLKQLRQRYGRIE